MPHSEEFEGPVGRPRKESDYVPTEELLDPGLNPEETAMAIEDLRRRHEKGKLTEDELSVLNTMEIERDVARAWSRGETPHRGRKKGETEESNTKIVGRNIQNQNAPLVVARRDAMKQMQAERNRKPDRIREFRDKFYAFSTSNEPFTPADIRWIKEARAYLKKVPVSEIAPVRKSAPEDLKNALYAVDTLLKGNNMIRAFPSGEQKKKLCHNISILLEKLLEIENKESFKKVA